MKHLKYLNVVLTVIAVCLVLITMAVTGVLPAANAKELPPRYVAVPVNADGTINVNLTQMGGEDIRLRALPVNVKEVDGRPVRSNPLPVVSGK
jgi:biopolymer transport protein ExbD